MVVMPPVYLPHGQFATIQSNKRSSDEASVFSNFLMGGLISNKKQKANPPSSASHAFTFGLNSDTNSSTITEQEQEAQFLAFNKSLLSLMAVTSPSALTSVKPLTSLHFDPKPVKRSPVTAPMNLTLNQPTTIIPTCLPVSASIEGAAFTPAGESTLDLPPRIDGKLEHHSKRQCFPLSTEEDMNWISDFLCYVRTDVIEVFRAGKTDVSGRAKSKSIDLNQIGLRCRFCAHLPKRQRARRSACFPSSTDRIYQSMTMMIRDHFGKCQEFQGEARAQFDDLRQQAAQGASDSKKYWASSAKKLGMVNTDGQGIMITAASRQAARSLAGSEMAATVVRNAQVTGSSVVAAGDEAVTSKYMFLLMQQINRVYLTEEERVGNRKTMELNFAGFGCRYCNNAGRKAGLCRFFPARRRTLPLRLKDFSDHLMKCQLCPEETKARLQALDSSGIGFAVLQEAEEQKDYIDQIWRRLQSHK